MVITFMNLNSNLDSEIEVGRILHKKKYLYRFGVNDYHFPNGVDYKRGKKTVYYFH